MQSYFILPNYMRTVIRNLVYHRDSNPKPFATSEIALITLTRPYLSIGEARLVEHKDNMLNVYLYKCMYL